MSASKLADKIATELAIANDTGAFDTRCFTENVELIIAALRHYAAPAAPDAQIQWGYPNHPGVAGPCSFADGSYWNGSVWTRPPQDFATIRPDLKTT